MLFSLMTAALLAGTFILGISGMIAGYEKGSLWISSMGVLAALLSLITLAWLHAYTPAKVQPAPPAPTTTITCIPQPNSSFQLEEDGMSISVSGHTCTVETD